MESEGNMLSERQIQMLLWEVLIATSDTPVVTTEWALYELAIDSKRQVDTFFSWSKIMI